MQFRLSGLVPALALLAVGVAHSPAQAQTTGSMAFPQSLPSGQVSVPAPSARDTGNMAYPASPGGVSERAPTGPDTGNMATPTGRSAIGTRGGRSGQMAANPPMRPDVAPMADTASARSLAEAPSAAPVPYTSFDAPKPAGRGMMMHKGAKPMAMHHAAAKKMAKPVKAAAAK